jgi:mycothione reductase
MTKTYDLIVVGSGSGATVADSALYHGWSVAWIDQGPLGGTCLNVGCIPSKVLIFPADRIVEIQEAGKLGVEATVDGIDFGAIMARMHEIVSHSQTEMRQGIEQSENLDFYETRAHFVESDGEEYELQVGDQRIGSRRVVLASGARPLIPPIEGLDGVDYLTNESVLGLNEQPESLVIVGGGYISVEYAHFFAAMGTRVTILQRNGRLVPEEEPEISELLESKLARRLDVFTHTEVVEVRQEEDSVAVVGRDTRDGETRTVTAQRVMIAAGRRSNADLLRVEDAGIETDEWGYVKVDEYLQTNADGVWALGDATGGSMFKHVANREASLLWHNLAHGHKAPMDYSAVPHAVFSHPQIASVGLTEAQARKEFDILVGRAKYSDVAKGEAMMENDGFAKAVVEQDSGKILGFHIIGPYAPILIQEVVNAMAGDGTIDYVGQAMHIHPALPELVVSALYNLQEP